MATFAEHYEQLNETKAKITIHHKLWNTAQYISDRLHIINDDERIGVVIKNSEIFVYKKNVVRYDIIRNTYIMDDGRMVIIIKKL